MLHQYTYLRHTYNKRCCLRDYLCQHNLVRMYMYVCMYKIIKMLHYYWLTAIYWRLSLYTNKKYMSDRVVCNYNQLSTISKLNLFIIHTYIFIIIRSRVNKLHIYWINLNSHLVSFVIKSMIKIVKFIITSPYFLTATSIKTN